RPGADHRHDRSGADPVPDRERRLPGRDRPPAAIGAAGVRRRSGRRCPARRALPYGLRAGRRGGLPADCGLGSGRARRRLRPAGLTPGEEAMPASGTYRGWTIVALIFLFMLINYADKAVIGLSAVPIMRELGLSNTQFGTLGSAF